MFQVHIGERDLPGDKETSPNWPYVRPGKWGATNAMSPKYVGDLVDRILAAKNKTRVLWIYGDKDLAVSNSAASDPGTWGPSGAYPVSRVQKVSAAADDGPDQNTARCLCRKRRMV